MPLQADTCRADVSYASSATWRCSASPVACWNIERSVGESQARTNPGMGGARQGLPLTGGQMFPGVGVMLLGGRRPVLKPYIRPRSTELRVRIGHSCSSPLIQRG